MSNNRRPIVMEDAQIIFRNFSGKGNRYNREGSRNFCVVIPEENYDDFSEPGWNIKELKPRDEGDEPLKYTQIMVNYLNSPPKIVLVSGKKKTILDEESVGILDWEDITHVDLIINPYLWEINDTSGIKGYVKTMYVTVYEADFESRYYEDNE